MSDKRVKFTFDESGLLSQEELSEHMAESGYYSTIKDCGGCKLKQERIAELERQNELMQALISDAKNEMTTGEDGSGGNGRFRGGNMSDEIEYYELLNAFEEGQEEVEKLNARLADLEAQLAEARTQLRIAANYRHTTEGEHDDGDFSICRHPACEYAQAAIDGGALKRP